MEELSLPEAEVRKAYDLVEFALTQIEHWGDERGKESTFRLTRKMWIDSLIQALNIFELRPEWDSEE